ncbi:MAG TPA: TIGR03086 family metal-binding protein [Mycobacteriales bacterium]|jgi:uncharacterized protein (TIGR03086 family)
MHDFFPASAATARVVALVTDEHLDLPTPCEAWPVRDLLEHIVGFTAHFAAIGRQEELTGEPPASGLPEGWRTMLADALEDLTVAWRTPGAWEGQDEAGGVAMPRAALGVVALDELVLHGWDLATAIQVPFAAALDDVQACLPFVEQFSGMQGGPFGAPLAGAQEATGLNRLLMLAGRDPAIGPDGGVG